MHLSSTPNVTLGRVKALVERVTNASEKENIQSFAILSPDRANWDETLLGEPREEDDTVAWRGEQEAFNKRTLQLMQNELKWDLCHLNQEHHPDPTKRHRTCGFRQGQGIGREEQNGVITHNLETAFLTINLTLEDAKNLKEKYHQYGVIYSGPETKGRVMLIETDGQKDIGALWDLNTPEHKKMVEEHPEDFPFKTRFKERDLVFASLSKFAYTKLAVIYQDVQKTTHEANETDLKLRFLATGEEWKHRLVDQCRHLSKAVLTALAHFESVQDTQNRNKLIQAVAQEWPTPSQDDSSKIEYTRSPEQGEAGRRTVTSVGKWFSKVLPDVFGGRAVDSLLAAHASPQYTLKYITDNNEMCDHMRYAYHNRCGFLSCMADPDLPEPHPYCVYTPELGWKMALLYRSATILARGLVCGNSFVTLYGEDSAAIAALKSALEAEGMNHATSWVGKRIALVQNENNDIVVPWLDGDPKTGDLDFDTDTILITPGGELSLKTTAGFVGMDIEGDHEGETQIYNGDWVPESEAVFVNNKGDAYLRSDCVNLYNGEWGLWDECTTTVDGEWVLNEELEEVCIETPEGWSLKTNALSHQAAAIGIPLAVEDVLHPLNYRRVGEAFEVYADPKSLNRVYDNLDMCGFSKEDFYSEATPLQVSQEIWNGPEGRVVITPEGGSSHILFTPTSRTSRMSSLSKFAYTKLAIKYQDISRGERNTTIADLRENFIKSKEEWKFVLLEKHPSLSQAVLNALAHLEAVNDTANSDKLIQVVAQEWPTPSTEDPSKIAYTRSPEHGETGRRTVTSVGKWFSRVLPDVFGGRAMDALIAAHASPQDQLVYVTDNDEMIEHMQTARSRGCDFGSCMTHTKLNKLENHPYAVYTPELGWKMALLYRGEDVIARCLVCDNEYVRTYGDDSSAMSALEMALEDDGKNEVSSWRGKFIAYIETDDGIVAPYLDGSIKRGEIYDDDRIEITSRGDLDFETQSGFVSRGVETYDGNWIDEDDAVLLTTGRSEGEYAHRNDAIETYDGQWALESECTRMDAGSYEGDWALDSEVVRDAFGNDVLQDDCTELYNDEWVLDDDLDKHCVKLHDGNWALKDDDDIVELHDGKHAEKYDCTEVRGDKWVLDADLEEVCILVKDTDGDEDWAVKDECVQIQNGEFAHRDDCYESYTGGWVLDNDSYVFLAGTEGGDGWPMVALDTDKNVVEIDKIEWGKAKCNHALRKDCIETHGGKYVLKGTKGKTELVRTYNGEWASKEDCRRLPDGEWALKDDKGAEAKKALRSPESAYLYARDVLGRRWEEAEPVIATDPKLAYKYALEILKPAGIERFEMAEPYIAKAKAKDLLWAYEYALSVLKPAGVKRFELAEPALATDPKWAYLYASDVLKPAGIKRFELAEPTLAEDPEFAYYYARWVLKPAGINRFELGEPAIAQEPEWARAYALEVLKPAGLSWEDIGVSAH